MKTIRTALAQINPTVGDIRGNIRKIISYIKKAREKKADIIAFPELAVTGYPPEDLLLKPHFIQDNIDAIGKIEQASDGITVITGFVNNFRGLYNAAAVISNGRLVDVYHKKHLPNYGVFDEYRYFRRGNRFPVYNFNGVDIGVNICEDIWIDNGPARIQALSGAELIININASPYHMGKLSFREDLLKTRAVECDAAIVYVNMVGGQDELVFDGCSLASDHKGNIIMKGKEFAEDLVVTDIKVRTRISIMTPVKKRKLRALLGRDDFVEKMDIPVVIEKDKPKLAKRKPQFLEPAEEVYHALMLGTRDYVSKNGFRGVVVAMSGGVDSALTAMVAVDALGKKNVHGLFMPSKYTSRESREDALLHAKNIGIKITSVPITATYNSYLRSLSKHFGRRKPDTTEENLQARIRGNILMAFSNKFNWMVLTTGNKSEMSVGYATLYGDMAGGFAVLKDVPKTLVYKLCEWRNAKEGRDIIPERIIWKEPSAELKPDQRDIDTLPPYPVLDPILKAYIEDDRSFADIKEMGCNITCAKKVISMVDHSEYKRRQAPPGIKITPRAFGKDRRFPITNKYKSY